MRRTKLDIKTLEYVRDDIWEVMGEIDKPETRSAVAMVIIMINALIVQETQRRQVFRKISLKAAKYFTALLGIWALLSVAIIVGTTPF